MVRELTERLAVGDGSAIDGAVVLLVTDEYRTGWTTTTAAALLRASGARRVLPLVAHQRP